MAKLLDDLMARIDDEWSRQQPKKLLLLSLHDYLKHIWLWWILFDYGSSLKYSY